MEMIVDKNLAKATGHELEHWPVDTKALLKVVDLLSFLLGVRSKDIAVKVFLAPDEEDVISKAQEGDLLITKLPDKYGDPVCALCEAVKGGKDCEELGWLRLW